MGLADAIRSARRTQTRGPACTVGALVLDPDDAAALTAALADPTITTTTILAALVAEGHDLHYDALRRHRRTVRGRAGGCACAV